MSPLKKSATKVTVTITRARSAKPAKAARSVKSAKPLPVKAAADSPKSTKRVYTRRAKLFSSKVSYKGKVFHVTTDKVQEPNGTVVTRDVIHHNGSIVILAVDATRKPRDPDVILIRQYRHAAGQYLLELPAGRVEPGERLLAAAKREMIEETGFRARKWTPLTRYYASPGFLGEWMQIYVAEDLTEGDAQPEGDEDIELMRMPLSEAMRLVAANKIHDGKTLIGLSLYAVAHRNSRKAAAKRS